MLSPAPVQHRHAPDPMRPVLQEDEDHKVYDKETLSGSGELIGDHRVPPKRGDGSYISKTFEGHK